MRLDLGVILAEQEFRATNDRPRLKARCRWIQYLEQHRVANRLHSEVRLCDRLGRVCRARELVDAPTEEVDTRSESVRLVTNERARVGKPRSDDESA